MLIALGWQLFAGASNWYIDSRIAELEKEKAKDKTAIAVLASEKEAIKHELGETETKLAEVNKNYEIQEKRLAEIQAITDDLLNKYNSVKPVSAGDISDIRAKLRAAGAGTDP